MPTVAPRHEERRPRHGGRPRLPGAPQEVHRPCHRWHLRNDDERDAAHPGAPRAAPPTHASASRAHLVTASKARRSGRSGGDRSRSALTAGPLSPTIPLPDRRTLGTVGRGWVRCSTVKTTVDQPWRSPGGSTSHGPAREPSDPRAPIPLRRPGHAIPGRRMETAERARNTAPAGRRREVRTSPTVRP